MHNIFITELMDWKPCYRSRKVRLVNLILKRLGYRARLVPLLGSGSMTNTEQRMNLFHLVSQVLVYDIPGDLVELGCHQGQTGVLFGKLIEAYAPERRLHEYDVFPNTSAVEIVRQNFASVGARHPEIHVGWIEDTVPDLLPDRICFAHIDVGCPTADAVKALVMHCLEHVYPRLSKGGICVLQDYCDPSIFSSWNPWPAVKAASDEFFRDKLEDVSVLYANTHSHGFVRKK
jgi:O-methyltransferase